MTVRVPAKVNLQLAVGPVRADGYHDVATVYHAVSLFDQVTVGLAEHDSVAITGEGADSVPTDVVGAVYVRPMDAWCSGACPNAR